tara:strand:+ start:368 stop:583 length:216 start_codon:yes stop_codon:yes gene_type:complete
MEYFVIVFFSIILAGAQFAFVMWCAKKWIGKDPKGWVMFAVLFLSGPFGWTVLIMAWVIDMVDRVFPRKNV